MFYFIFSLLIVLADQAMKYFVTLKLSLGGQIALIPGLVHLTYVRNTGAAYSILTEYTWLLTIISALASVFIIILIIKLRVNFWCRLTLAGVLGGAVGNLIDRVLLGYVVDMFEFEFVHYAVFNVADVFISVGGVLFCIFYLAYSIKMKNTPPPKKETRMTELFAGDENISDTHILTEYEFSVLRSDENVHPVMPDDIDLTFLEDESADKDD